ncbi:hypothetical protein NLI96_g6312 [Meripilus lineatus]|uniref:Aminoglycoside phosphotransferase domain-containing protein n=1 Tax=Meripilus lineatus TaxID=2056292 RepID=A0AAD5YI68_9APHY|nr:hypothetical protein NLI96_g6312 [Physisporinus lineatus]
MKPRFPDILSSGYPLQCPQIHWRPTSPRRAKFWWYVHERILKPLSDFYVRYYHGKRNRTGVHVLPFGLFLKSHENIREQEAMAMNLARAMGIPAPRALTFGAAADIPGTIPSILMTKVPGKHIGQVPTDQINFDVIKDDLTKILARMRSFASPWGDAVCGVDGRDVAGRYIPGTPIPPADNEAGFYQSLKDATMFDRDYLRNSKDAIAGAEELFRLPPHAIVFTHGDMQWHNIMITPDSHISGIVDWESAGWLPDYWEFSTAAIKRGPWGRIMNEEIAHNIYQKEVVGHYNMFLTFADLVIWNW